MCTGDERDWVNAAHSLAVIINSKVCISFAIPQIQSGTVYIVKSFFLLINYNYGAFPVKVKWGDTRIVKKELTWKGFSPVWTSWCLFSFELSTKALPHSAQTCTRGPWVCKCFLIAELSLNILVHPWAWEKPDEANHSGHIHLTV